MTFKIKKALQSAKQRTFSLALISFLIGSLLVSLHKAGVIPNFNHLFPFYLICTLSLWVGLMAFYPIKKSKKVSLKLKANF